MLRNSKTKISKNSNPITEQVVKDHLLQLGYDGDALNPQDLQDFITELQELWERNGLKEFPNHSLDKDFDEDGLVEELIGEGSKSKTIQGVSGSENHRITRKDYPPKHSSITSEHSGHEHHEIQHLQSFASSLADRNEHRIVTIKSGHDAEVESKYYKDEVVDQAVNMVSSLNLEGFKQKAMEQKLKGNYGSASLKHAPKSDSRSSSPEISYADDYSSFEEYSSRLHDISLISRPTTTSSTNTRPHRKTTGLIKTAQPFRPKKNDPVSRFHQHNDHWKKDTFLKRQESKKSSSEAGRWGGMAAVIHEQPTKIRHNLNAKRSDYVIPSQKKRTDLVWETRQRMANIDK